VISVLTNNRARTAVVAAVLLNIQDFNKKSYTVSGKSAVLMFQRITVPSSSGSSSPRRETIYPTTQHNTPKQTQLFRNSRFEEHYMCT